MNSADYFQAWFDHQGENELESNKYLLHELNEFIKDLDKQRHRYKDQTRFLEYVYYKVHRTYLHQYQSPSPLKDLFEDRKYDCLTGTALYSIILEKLGVSYDIFETTYHIYITLNINDKKVLIESTSPLDGFIVDEKMVTAALQHYQQDDESGIWANKEYYQPLHSVNNRINLTELAGLQYFNQAVAAYNQRHLELALKDLSKALEYYPSHRLKEMMVVMLNTLEGDEKIDPLIKQEYLSRYSDLRGSIITAYKAH